MPSWTPKRRWRCGGRVPRVLEVVATARAVLTLVDALEDKELDVRIEVARSLSRMVRTKPELAPPKPTIFDAVVTELAWEASPGKSIPPQSGNSSLLRSAEEGVLGPPLPGGRVGRRIEHVFTMLSVALEPEPVRLAYLALGTENETLRGTALEYIEAVLPEPRARAAFESHWRHERAPRSRPLGKHRARRFVEVPSDRRPQPRRPPRPGRRRVLGLFGLARRYFLHALRVLIANARGGENPKGAEHQVEAKEHLEARVAKVGKERRRRHVDGRRR